MDRQGANTEQEDTVIGGKRERQSDAEREGGGSIILNATCQSCVMSKVLFSELCVLSLVNHPSF